jgi:hypothetical protein
VAELEEVQVTAGRILGTVDRISYPGWQGGAVFLEFLRGRIPLAQRG